MATISNANLTALADSVAKALVDLESAYITNPTNNAPTIATITTGMGTQKGKVAALNDVAQEAALAQATITDTANVLAYMSLANSAFYALYRDLMNALDNHVGGLSSFLTTNTLQVHPEFAACFNNWASNAVSLGQRGAAPTAIPATQIFPSAGQTLASIAVTGAAAGTFSAGTALNTANVAAQQLYLKNTAGVATGGTATSFTITYTNAAGVSGQTATQALSGALAAGATLAIGTTVGSAVSNIVVNSGGVAADAIAVVVVPLRTVAY